MSSAEDYHALEQALASEAAARSSKDDAASELRQREAELARAEAAMKAAAAALHTAAAELEARESAWLASREVALRTAHNELGSKHTMTQELAELDHQTHDHHASDHHTNGHHAPGHHGHDHDDPFHSAKHQLEHRWVEKTAFGIAERVVERTAERVGERIAERGAEVAVEKVGAVAARHIVTRLLGETLRMGEHAAMQALKMLRVLVPFVGMFFVFHLAEHDWLRLTEEWGKRRIVTSGLFLLAVAGDILDILAHAFVVSAGLVHMDHHFLHTIEYYGISAAVVACLSVMAGEVLSARATHRASKRSPVRVVPVTAHDISLGA